MYPQHEDDFIFRGIMLEHVGHALKMVTYGKQDTGEIWNVALECETCWNVLIDFETDWFKDNVDD